MNRYLLLAAVLPATMAGAMEPLSDAELSDVQGAGLGFVLDQVLLARTPVKRLVEPDEVAAVVAFLCGPGTASVNGTSYLMDGGWTAA